MTIGYVIDPIKREVRPVEYEDYRTMLEYLPGGLTTGWVWSDGDVCYVDDEGLLRPATCAFRFRQRKDGQPMMSYGFVTGRDSDDGESTLNPSATPEGITARIEWLTVPEALAWFRERAAESAVTIARPGERPTTISAWSDFLKYLDPDHA